MRASTRRSTEPHGWPSVCTPRPPRVSTEAGVAGADAALIATPPEFHAEVALPYLLAGRSVLIEKPFAPTLADAEKLLEAARAGNARVLVAHMRRLYPAIRVAREVVRSGVLGDIRAAEAREGSRWEWGAASAYVVRSSFGGVLYDTGSHVLDTLLFLLDLDAPDSAPTVVVESVARDRAAEPSHDFRAHFRLCRGGSELPVEFHVSRTEALPRSVVLHGEHASLVVGGGFAQQPTVIAGKRAMRLDLPLDMPRPADPSGCFRLEHEALANPSASPRRRCPARWRAVRHARSAVRYSGLRLKPPMSPPTVVLFGATSYLGQYVLDDLVARGYRVVAVTRNPAVSEILLHPWKDRITVIAPDQLGATGEAETVLNLAYIKVEKPHRLFRQNALLMQRVHDAAVRLGAARLVHVSTQAVFGYEFDEPPRPVRAVRRAGDSYVETKVHAELLLEELQSRAPYRLDIVRLGNIVGEGSPAWTANLAQRLLDGRPVGVAGRDGYSNAAFSPNIASYLGHLVNAPVSSGQEMGRYHHFADLSVLRWSAFIARFAEAVGVAPVLAASVAAPPRVSLRPAIAGTIRTLYRGPIGRLTRRSLARVEADDAIDAAMFAIKTAVGAGSAVDPFEVPHDRDLLAILVERARVP